MLEWERRIFCRLSFDLWGERNCEERQQTTKWQANDVDYRTTCSRSKASADIIWWRFRFQLFNQQEKLSSFIAIIYDETEIEKEISERMPTTERQLTMTIGFRFRWSLLSDSRQTFPLRRRMLESWKRGEGRNWWENSFCKRASICLGFIFNRKVIATKTSKRLKRLRNIRHINSIRVHSKFIYYH